MLKRIYVSAAQAAPGFIPNGRSVYLKPAPERPVLGRWFASLGAIYHLDRMIALDIPWWNVAATADVEAFLKRRGTARVFEYGSGASTVWLAHRGANVTSVEHDPDWAGKLVTKLGDYANARLDVRPYDPAGNPADEPYVKAVETDAPYDMIVVDGRLRTHCLNAAIPYLKPDGIILFDDSGRKRYRSAIAACGLVEKHYFGLSYCVPYPDHTSVLTNAPWP